MEPWRWSDAIRAEAIELHSALSHEPTAITNRHVWARRLSKIPNSKSLQVLAPSHFSRKNCRDMQPHESPQLRTTLNGKRQHDTCVRNVHGYNLDQGYFTSDFDPSSTMTAVSLHDEGRREPLKRRKRLFAAWVVKLNNDNELIVEGSLECGRRARTKPIAERLGALKILSKFRHLYYLVGNMAHSQYELPAFVRRRFHAGFPEDWKIVVGSWRRFVISASNAEIRQSCISASSIVEKESELAVDSRSNSHHFMDHPGKVNKVDNDTRPTNENVSGENIRRHRKDVREGRRIVNQNMEKSNLDRESQDDQISRTIDNIRQLTGWTPFLILNESRKSCLAFKGTLLSSMGHAVNKNHATDAVRRRLSARIIETVNQEFYELVGDVNNTKHDVPQLLIPWCRYGCPKRIHSFCERWRILSSDHIKYRTRLSQESRTLHCLGVIKLGRHRGATLTICHEKSADLIANDRTNSSMIQPAREKNKRKRLSVEVTNNSSTSDASIHDNMINGKEPDAISINNSGVGNWPKVGRKMCTNLRGTPRINTDLTKGEHLKIIEQVRPTATHNENLRPLRLNQAPSLTCVYNRCAPSTESILSDSV